MQVARHARAHVDVLCDRLHLGRVGEVRGADGLAHHVPVRAARLHPHLELRADVEDLLAHLLDLAHGLGVHEVARAPVAAVAVLLPLLVHVEQGEVVRLGREEPTVTVRR